MNVVVWAKSEQRGTKLAEAREAAIAGPNDAVEKRDAEELAGLGKALGDVAVLAAGRGITGRVVVRDDESASTEENCGLKDLARMDERCGCSAHADDLVRDGPVSAVEIDGHEVLARVVGDCTPHECGNVRG